MAKTQFFFNLRQSVLLRHNSKGLGLMSSSHCLLQFVKILGCFFHPREITHHSKMSVFYFISILRSHPSDNKLKLGLDSRSGSYVQRMILSMDCLRNSTQPCCRRAVVRKQVDTYTYSEFKLIVVHEDSSA